MPIGRIAIRTAACTVVAGIAALALGSLTLPVASAAPIVIDGCKDGQVYAPVGSVLSINYAACGADILTIGGHPLFSDDYADNALSSTQSYPSLIGTSASVTVTSAFSEVYANTPNGKGSNTGPWGATQFNLFVFRCGVDSASFLATVDGSGTDFRTFASDPAIKTQSYCAGTGSSDARPIWHQSVSRVSEQAACATGFSASWAQWPNNGAGGWVCNKEQFAYGS